MKKILAIDDNTFITFAIQDYLTTNGFEVETVNDAEKAIDEIKRIKPDMILLDLMMPGISGEELFDRIKGDSEISNIPVIILTAKTNAVEYAPSLKTAQDFISKPFEPDDLLKRINKYL